MQQLPCGFEVRERGLDRWAASVDRMTTCEVEQHEVRAGESGVNVSDMFGDGHPTRMIEASARVEAPVCVTPLFLNGSLTTCTRNRPPNLQDGLHRSRLSAVSSMIETRYNYTGAYASPETTFFGHGDWLTEESCRKEVAMILRDKRYVPESIRVLVQQRKSRWTPLRDGTVSDIFPDLWHDYLCDVAIAQLLSLPEYAAYKVEAASAISRGLAQTITSLESELRRGGELLALLRQIQRIR